MNIIAITSCTMGIGHTYIARDRLIETAEKFGHSIKVETQGSVGIENELTMEDVKNADIVIIAADVNVSGQKRFAGKPVVKVPVSAAIKQPQQLISKIEEKFKGDE